MTALVVKNKRAVLIFRFRLARRSLVVSEQVIGRISLSAMKAQLSPMVSVTATLIVK